MRFTREASAGSAMPVACSDAPFVDCARIALACSAIASRPLSSTSATWPWPGLDNVTDIFSSGSRMLFGVTDDGGSGLDIGGNADDNASDDFFSTLSVLSDAMGSGIPDEQTFSGMDLSASDDGSGAAGTVRTSAKVAGDCMASCFQSFVDSGGVCDHTAQQNDVVAALCSECHDVAESHVSSPDIALLHGGPNSAATPFKSLHFNMPATQQPLNHDGQQAEVPVPSASPVAAFSQPPTPAKAAEPPSLPQPKPSLPNPSAPPLQPSLVQFVPTSNPAGPSSQPPTVPVPPLRPPLPPPSPSPANPPVTPPKVPPSPACPYPPSAPPALPPQPPSQPSPCEPPTPPLSPPCLYWCSEQHAATHCGDQDCQACSFCYRPRCAQWCTARFELQHCQKYPCSGCTFCTDEMGQCSPWCKERSAHQHCPKRQCQGCSFCHPGRTPEKHRAVPSPPAPPPRASSKDFMRTTPPPLASTHRAETMPASPSQGENTLSYQLTQNPGTKQATSLNSAQPPQLAVRQSSTSPKGPQKGALELTNGNTALTPLTPPPTSMVSGEHTVFTKTPLQGTDQQSSHTVGAKGSTIAVNHPVSVGTDGKNNHASGTGRPTVPSTPVSSSQPRPITSAPAMPPRLAAVPVLPAPGTKPPTSAPTLSKVSTNAKTPLAAAHATPPLELLHSDEDADPQSVKHASPSVAPAAAPPKNALQVHPSPAAPTRHRAPSLPTVREDHKVPLDSLEPPAPLQPPNLAHFGDQAENAAHLHHGDGAGVSANPNGLGNGHSSADREVSMSDHLSPLTIVIVLLCLLAIVIVAFPGRVPWLGRSHAMYTVQGVEVPSAEFERGPENGKVPTTPPKKMLSKMSYFGAAESSMPLVQHAGDVERSSEFELAELDVTATQVARIAFDAGTSASAGDSVSATQEVQLELLDGNPKSHRVREDKA